ncbi:MAG: nucleotidyltransferase domain-containing protein [Acidobacteriota bacterium]
MEAARSAGPSLPIEHTFLSYEYNEVNDFKIIALPATNPFATRENGTFPTQRPSVEPALQCSYADGVKSPAPALSPDGLRLALHAFCEKHPIRRLDVFGSAARGQAGPGSDVDLLVTLDDAAPVSTLEILEMAGEAEEIVGAPVDFVLLQALEQSPNAFARDHILATAVQLYGR